MTRERLTFVIAAHNEELVLPQLHPRVCAVLDGLAGIDGHILYVDDGSTDTTWSLIASLAQADPRVSALKLSRNFGKEAALRRKVDQIEGQDGRTVAPLIQTRRGVGYMLREPKGE